MSRPQFDVATWLSLCLFYLFVSRPRFDVATSFMLSASLLLGHNFSFRVRHHSVILSLQTGRDQVVSLIIAIPVATSKVCRDHSFFLSSRNLISQSQQFPFNFLFLVVTSVPCRDIIVCCLLHFCVVTSICCRDIISVVSHSFLVTTPLFMLRLKIVCPFMVLSRHGI